MTARRYTEEEILIALDGDAADVAKESAAGASDPGDADVYWPWSREAALLIRELQGKVDSLFAGHMLALEFMAGIRPHIVADFLIRHMRSGDPEEARQARDMAQYFRETSDPIGSLLDRSAEAYDLRAQQGAAQVDWIPVSEKWPPIGEESDKA